MTARARVLPADVARALKGVTAAGYRPGRVEIDEHGRIIILLDQAVAQDSPNPWDEVENHGQALAPRSRNRI
jgi:hypothetical protein